MTSATCLFPVIGWSLPLKVCPLELTFTWGFLRMFFYHWEFVPVTGSSNNSVPLNANQTGRGRGFPVFLPVTVNSISFSFFNAVERLSDFNLDLQSKLHPA